MICVHVEEVFKEEQAIKEAFAITILDTEVVW